jgi:putative component of membrane protein insertase Oxa1/YidC/SpoIIIJ protein YidD
VPTPAWRVQWGIACSGKMLGLIAAVLRLRQCIPVVHHAYDKTSLQLTQHTSRWSSVRCFVPDRPTLQALL